jgi:hypothetical protein
LTFERDDRLEIRRSQPNYETLFLASAILRGDLPEDGTNYVTAVGLVREPDANAPRQVAATEPGP